MRASISIMFTPLRFALFIALLLCGFQIHAQSGCTDPAATNYSPAALSNDGSCLYAVTHYDMIYRAKFGTGIDESSGVIYTDGKLWTHNDSGNPNDIFAVDTNTGAILQTVIVDNYPNVDWEDISADSNYIYVSDCGNNNGTRQDLKILKIAKSDIGNAALVHVNAQAINLSYTDQTSFVSSKTHNFDCEALIAVNDSLYIFTKDRGDYRTRVYKMPKTPGTYALSPYTSFYAGGLITGADYNPFTKEVVLIGYLSGHMNSFLWFLNDFKEDSFFSGNKRRIEISNGQEWQTEGVCYFPNGRFLISNELTNSIAASFYVGYRSFQNPSAVGNQPTLAFKGLYPNPVKNTLFIPWTQQDACYTIYNANGQVIRRGTLHNGNNLLDLSSLLPGDYFITAQDAEHREYRDLFVKGQ